MPKVSGNRYVQAEIAFPWFIVDEFYGFHTQIVYISLLRILKTLYWNCVRMNFYDYLFFVSSKAYLPVKVVLDVRCCNGLYKVESEREFDVC